MNVRHHDDDGPNAGPLASIEQRGSHDAPHDQWRCTTAGEFVKSDLIYQQPLILKARNILPSYINSLAKAKYLELSPCST